MFLFGPSCATQRLVRRSLEQAARQATRTVKAANKAAVRSAERTMRETEKAASRSAKQAIRESKKVATRSVKQSIRQTERAVEAVVQATRGPEVVRQASGRFVTVDGMPVHVIARGRGRPVVLVHGNGTMAEDFAICGLIDRLATRYRVIALDRPGFGYTPRPRHRVWTASVQATLLRRVLEQLGVERPLVVGHSWGTIVSLVLAAEGRLPLRGLVLLSGYYFPEQRTDAALSRPLALPVIGDAARAMVPSAVNRALAEQSFRQVFWPQAVPTRFAARFPVEIAAASTQLRAVAEDAASMNAAVTLLQHRYPSLSLPVAILSGDADAIIDASKHSIRLHTAIPGSSLRLLPGLGHMIHYGARAKVERTIDDLMGYTLPSGSRRRCLDSCFGEGSGGGDAGAAFGAEGDIR